ncbi:GNAT family N-acetyltransferase [Siphonobacter sp. BAB-5385]|uniref:GNAT family N-acetyltransferase n=1 Tax=Siphonobacter sp. BAB-5385 TaxID=1864822 RepID=UPI000B9E86C4|nr:GNAT family N-acetyltransferase [Siphonobacter sp. BAB-5385]OZI05384.1 GNAT family N-acetyltransferase [Siphonobacter sp. BAB-5385]
MLPVFLIQTIPAQETYSLRHQVLWPDRPLASVKLTDDEQGLHYGAFYEGQLIGVISVFAETSDRFRFRKFAVDASWQGRGVGSALLMEVIAQVRTKKARILWCDARLTARSFYERFGMQMEGEVFYKSEVAYAKYRLEMTSL